jgi:diadenosine tetraphosphate (Ap4A) HIT family hydrolase
MECPYCSLKASDQKVVIRDDLVWFVEDRRYQGALKHSGVIIPVAHRETVFDLTESELAATFRLLRRVKARIDADFSPGGYNIGCVGSGNSGRWIPEILAPSPETLAD